MYANGIRIYITICSRREEHGPYYNNGRAYPYNIVIQSQTDFETSSPADYASQTGAHHVRRRNGQTDIKFTVFYTIYDNITRPSAHKIILPLRIFTEIVRINKRLETLFIHSTLEIPYGFYFYFWARHNHERWNTVMFV